MDKLKNILLILFASIFILTGCNNVDNNDKDISTNPTLNEDKDVVNEEVDTEGENRDNDEEIDKEDESQDNKNKEEDDDKNNIDDNGNEEVDNENAEETDNTEENKDESKNDDKDEEVSNVNQESFNISSIDAASDEKVVLGSVKIDADKSLEEKLNIVIDEIAKLQFNNAPIELVKIENNIAYIDLQEGEGQNYWSTGYFQGSTGGSITTYTLTESLLQKGYNGKWIDGIHFSYEGKTDIEFDHISMDFFGNIISR